MRFETKQTHACLSNNGTVRSETAIKPLILGRWAELKVSLKNKFQGGPPKPLLLGWGFPHVTQRILDSAIKCLVPPAIRGHHGRNPIENAERLRFLKTTLLSRSPAIPCNRTREWYQSVAFWQIAAMIDLSALADRLFENSEQLLAASRRREFLPRSKRLL